MYKAFFGLRSKPFRLSPDTRFLFASRGAGRALAFLKFGLHQREGLVLLTGEAGVGKSILVRSLVERLPREALTVSQVAATRGDGLELLQLVAAGFGVATPLGDGRAGVLQALRRHLIAQFQGGRRGLLIVDEAHNLTPDTLEELRLLSNLQVGPASLIQIFLIGQPVVRRLLQAPTMSALRQRILAADHLEALDAEEVGRYVQFRMRRVGWKEASPFDADAVGQIHAGTRGIARQVNTLCDRLLMQAFVEGRQAINGADVAAVLAEIDAEWAPRLAGDAPGTTAMDPVGAPVTAPRSVAPPNTPANTPANTPPNQPEHGVTVTAGVQPRNGATHGIANGAANTIAHGGVRGDAPSPGPSRHTAPTHGQSNGGIDDEVGEGTAASRSDGTTIRLHTLESRMAALETSTAQVAKVSRAILGRIDAGKPV